MKVYNIYHHENLNKFLAIKQGFSWTGFLLGLFWTVYNRLWLQSFVYLVYVILSIKVEGIMYIYYDYDTTVLFNIIHLCVGLVIGWNGNRWKEIDICKRGYTLVQSEVAASNEDEAISRV